MKISLGKIPVIAQEIVAALLAEGDIEVRSEEIGEVELDFSSVLKEYTRVERDITDRARGLIATRGLEYTALNKLKRQIAEQQGFGLGDEAIEYLVLQMIEMLLHTVHVDEVYAEDNVLRRKMGEVLRKHMAPDTELDKEVRRRIKNLQEGSAAWEVEYRNVMDNLKRNRGES